MKQILHASSASRRVACPGSFAMESRVKNEQTQFAKDGEAAHDLALNLLIEPDYIDHIGIKPGDLHANGAIITEEMISAVEQYTAVLESVIATTADKYAGGVEHKIEAKSINAHCTGIVDAWIFDISRAKLHIFDFKYGHKFVDVFENYQLIEYAAGILEQLEVKHKIDSIILYIVQPRNYGPEGKIRTWEITRGKIEDYFNRLRDAEALALEPHAPCFPSVECTNCRARYMCTALQQAVYTRLDTIFDQQMNTLTPEQLTHELEWLEDAEDLINARLTSLSVQATEIIQGGGRVAGYHLVQSMGREKWDIPINDVIALGEAHGKDLRKQIEVVTPNQAITKFKIPRAVVEQNTVRYPGEFKLKRDNVRKLLEEL